MAEMENAKTAFALFSLGAAGRQCGPLVIHVINDPELFKQFKIRGVTRDPTYDKDVMDSAVAVGAQYFILNTLSNTIEITRGKYQHIDHFDVKHDIEKYTRAQPLKSGFFIQNFTHNIAPRPLAMGHMSL
ncbi:hypothetical protein BGZ80_004804 [Entomortierella chlamydospora]|uniref:NmrA-like domain-containing protein n=1 Tax=Entomortierella chlamydospora TaxID=101097 RepID=A0A9P6MMK9_9FUNG|nr:hypothetical protein BGZ80_004804 [Entomortierella chlamydospora]